MKRSNLTIALYMLVVFVSGILVGGIGHRLYTVRTVSAVAKVEPRRTPEEWRQRYVEAMRTRLSLSDDQLGKLNVILDGTRTRYRAGKEKHNLEMRQIHDDQVSQIKAMLDPAQQVRYDEFRAERETRRREAKKSSGL